MGRRNVYLIGLGGYTLGYAALALGVQAGLWGWISAGRLFVLLLVLRLAYGLVVGGVSPAATAYIADTTDGGISEPPSLVRVAEAVMTRRTPRTS